MGVPELNFEHAGGNAFYLFKYPAKIVEVVKACFKTCIRNADVRIVHELLG